MAEVYIVEEDSLLSWLLSLVQEDLLPFPQKRALNWKRSYLTQKDYKLKAQLKVPRPVNIKPEKGAIENFKKKLGQQIISSLEQYQDSLGVYEQIRSNLVDIYIKPIL